MRRPAPAAAGRPSVPQFQTYLPWFLSARPSAGCAKGGMGAYSDALQRADPADPTSVAGLLPGGPAHPQVLTCL